MSLERGTDAKSRLAWIVSALGRDEELAVRALEPAVALRASFERLRRERFLAVRADDLALVLGGLGHERQRTYGRQDRNVSTAPRAGGGGSPRGEPRWISPRKRSPSGSPTASRPALVRSTRGVRQ